MTRFTAILVAIVMPVVAGGADLKVQSAAALALNAAADRETKGVADRAYTAMCTRAASPCGGICAGDIEECRQKCLKERLPLVVFVGPDGCQGAGVGLGDTIVCRVSDYHGDDCPTGDATPRIVLVTCGGPDFGGGDPKKLYIQAVMPAGTGRETILKAINAVRATVVVVKSIWFV